MSDDTAIEWTDATWNPVTGCDEVSDGCDNCYAKTLAERFRGKAGHYYESGFDLTLRPARLDQPLRWTRPRRIFVNSMSDLFHKDIPDEFVARVFAVMAASGRHTFQLLTKRHARMRALLSGDDFRQEVSRRAWELKVPGTPARTPWPLPNLWLGVSVEDQRWADIRIPALLDTPATVRWVSAEPLLGPLNLTPYLVSMWTCPACKYEQGAWVGNTHCIRCGQRAYPPPYRQQVDWVVAGGESGRGARPMHPDWVRSLRDQCQHAGTPYLFKQWGEWAPVDEDRPGVRSVHADGQGYGPSRSWSESSGWQMMLRVGKKRAGRELDGRIWDEYP